MTTDAQTLLRHPSGPGEKTHHRGRTLLRDITIGFVLVILVSSFMVTGAQYWILYRKAGNAFEAETESYLTHLQKSLEEPVWSFDGKTVDKICDTFFKNNAIVGLSVRDWSGEILFEKQKADQWKQTVSITRAIRNGRQPIGAIQMTVTPDLFKGELLRLVMTNLLIMAVNILAVIAAGGFLLRRYLRTPLDALVKQIGFIAQGEYDHPLPTFKHAETKDILSRFKAMSVEIEKRENRLQEMNAALLKEIHERKEALRRLEESEEQYRLIFDTAHDALIVSEWDTGRIIDANPYACYLYGYAREEMTTLRLPDLSIAPRKETDIESVQGSRTPTIYHRNKKGEPFPVEISVSHWKKDGRRVSISVIRDVLERHQMEEKLRTSERRMAQIINFLPDPTFVIDDESRVIAWNRAIEELTGVAAFDMIGKGNYEYAVPFYGTRRPVMIDLVGLWDKTIAGQYHYVRKKGDILVSETINPPFRRGGSHFWNAAGPLYDDDGRVIGAIETIRDITDIKKAEKALRESEFMFRSFFNSSPDGIVIVDLGGVILDTNKSILKMSGFETGELQSRNVTEFIAPRHHAKVQSIMTSVRSGISYDAPLQIDCVKKDDTIMPAAVRGWLITDEDSAPVAFGIFIKDLSREKALTAEKEMLEKQLRHTQKMEAIGALAGGIAHDFNNILGGVIGYAELALENLPGEAQTIRKYIARILEGGNRAKDLTHQILQFSRRDSSSLRALHIKAVVKEAVMLLRATVPSTIRIESQIDSDAGPILADATQVHQVVMNLCTNAYHAMRESGGVLTVRLQKTSLDTRKASEGAEILPGDYLVLTVEDTGPGIPAHIRNRIFEPYFTTKSVAEGTGLGLSVTLGLVKNHKGLVELESGTGPGAVFRVYFPCADVRPDKPKVASQPLPMGNGQRILLVDDEQFFLGAIREHLLQLGYEVIAYDNSIEMLKHYNKAPESFDLVITDQTMPEMTGIQLAAKIRVINPQIPIILCTGFSDVVTEKTAGHFGISRFIRKPVSRQLLANAVYDMLSASADAPNTDIH